MMLSYFFHNPPGFIKTRPAKQGESETDCKKEVRVRGKRESLQVVAAIMRARAMPQFSDGNAGQCDRVVVALPGSAS
jgi:hypothetical protein